MTELFYSGAVVAVIATLLVIVQTNVVHARIYLVLFARSSRCVL
jgi:NADH:ubiquinone oxidoreductase subunit 6 (subunit J)